ncbi:MAG TPA: alpha/beta fold hydrolase [Oscillatoriales cyanobacterium M4454_W2019_049]|nr:alpha/beta fold hydrolase [Oscillatoriales cyanobacterium M4454_W2019_049]
MTQYLYLHGFASSPNSTKARYFGDRFGEIGIELQVLDLNDGDFSHLTLTRQLQQAARYIDATPTTIIGSSFGGLTAAWLAEQYPAVTRLILLAPAFEFLSHWLPKLGEAQLQQWRDSGWLGVYHFGEGKVLPLHYSFVTDCQQYDETRLQRSVKTLILHGRHDEVIPVAASRQYAQSRPWVRSIELDSDHALGNVLEESWERIRQFLELG